MPAVFFMSSKVGMPKVGLLCFEASGLFLSWPPGTFSQATTPHMSPLHCATRILATPSATRQSPVGSAAKADTSPVAKNNAEYVTVRRVFRGQCNIRQTCALEMVKSWAKKPHCVFSVDEAAINRSK